MVENTNGSENAVNSALEGSANDANEQVTVKTENGNEEGDNQQSLQQNEHHHDNNGTSVNDETPKSAPIDPEPFRKLFVGGLSLTTTDEGLKNFYSQFGEILDCVVMKDNQTKKSRGFGFVSFTSKEEVDRAMAARPHEIDGKAVDPKRAVPRDQSARSESNISTKRLYVSGVREGHTEDALKDHFVQFGNVEKVEIINDKVTQKPRGFAFVSFDDYDSVDKCVLQKSHMISGFRCDVKKALSREDMARAQQMDRDRMERGGRSRGAQRGGPPGGAPWGGGRGYGGGYGAGGAWGAQGWGAQQGQWGPPGGGYGGGYGGYGGGAGGGGWGGAGGWGAEPAGGWGPGTPGGAQQWGGGPPGRY